MATSLSQLAQLVEGELIGNGAVEIVAAATLATATQNDISFLDDKDNARLVAKTQAAALVVPRDFVPDGLAAVQVDDVSAAFIEIVKHFRPQRAKWLSGVSPDAVISPTASLGPGINVHPGAVIGQDVEIGAGSTIHSGAQIMAGCKIGRDVTIFPNAVLYEDTVVGDRVIIHGGAVIGAYGFGYKTVEGRHEHCAQLGYVKIGDDVEIGATTTIDRGTYGPTVIGEGTKIDNLVQIGHNCRIGCHNILCSQVGIAGSTSTGDYVVMGGQVGVRDHVHIGTSAVLGAKAGVANDIADGMRALGAPAIAEREMKLQIVASARLPQMRKQLKDLQRTVEALLDRQKENDQDAGKQSAAAKL